MACTYNSTHNSKQCSQAMERTHLSIEIMKCFAVRQSQVSTEPLDILSVFISVDYCSTAKSGSAGTERTTECLLCRQNSLNCSGVLVQVPSGVKFG